MSSVESDSRCAGRTCEKPTVDNNNVIKRSFNNSIDRDEWLMANSSIATHYAYSVNLRQISLFLHPYHLLQ